MGRYGKKNFDVLKFIGLYKQCDVLWNMNLKTYRRNDLKLKAYRHIADEMGGMQIDEVKKKIKALRGTYIAERKKVEQSQRSLRGTEPVYEPTLFWYNAMKFVDPLIIQRRTSEYLANDTFDRSEEEKKPKIIQLYSEDTVSIEIDENPLHEQERAATPLFDDESEEMYAEEWTPLPQGELQSSKKSLPPTREYKNDEASIYAEGWAISYRKLDDTQKLYAKKAIEEILILGQLKQLTLHSIQTTPKSSNNFKFK